MMRWRGSAGCGAMSDINAVRGNNTNRWGIDLNKKLLFFVTEDWFVCSHWLPHMTAAREAGYEVYVVTRVRQHRSIIEARGVHVVPLELSRRGRNPIAELKVIAELIRIYREIRPDLVKHIAMKPIVYGTIAALFTRPRAVVNYIAGRGWLFTSDSVKARLLRPVVKWLLRWVLNRGHVIVENPNDLREMLGLGLVPERITRIPGAGVDMKVFLPTAEPDGPPLVVMAARMLWAKGVGEFVAAAELLKAEGVRARFVLVGSPDGENPSSVSVEQLEAWEKNGLVEWWGRRDDMPAVFKQAHIVCLPTSYGEGIPKVLIEAAASGRAIIATEIPGCREIVRHGENGFLVPIRNPVALAGAMRKLIVSKPLRERMGTSGRKIAQAGFSVEHVIAQTLAVYRGLLDGGPRLEG
ncbi:Glycosyltransferase involved in cell wall biosynthesis [Methylocaldum szegediense]|uniref:Glycosyltransferase involved in cell wall biosynthesis n=2 Tax=Methylocaldum szegediense TaxID=73780 RepID=A0ABN8WZ13_9GAMM|nr:Glycosyltransferase involved in cell wall biosynthesis [Methylocaldum szegediense]